MTDVNTPYSITGPATMNILAPRPVTNPSFLNSMAGDVTEFENPVIGTIEPAPANFPNFPYSPKPVIKEDIKINTDEVYIPVSFCVSPSSFK